MGQALVHLSTFHQFFCTSMSIRVAINGFGRIGRVTARMLVQRDDVELVAVNDLTDNATLAHLFKYDSVHGVFAGEVGHDPEHLILGGRRMKAFAVKDPAQLPWKALGIDVVIESTGFFLTRELASAHLKAGAKEIDPLGSCEGCRHQKRGARCERGYAGWNRDHHQQRELHHELRSADDHSGSRSPCGIEDGYITTVHSYTGDRRLHDAPHRMRVARVLRP